jgi:hypothetical protein
MTPPSRTLPLPTARATVMPAAAHLPIGARPSVRGRERGVAQMPRPPSTTITHQFRPPTGVARDTGGLATLATQDETPIA